MKTKYISLSRIILFLFLLGSFKSFSQGLTAEKKYKKEVDKIAKKKSVKKALEIIENLESSTIDNTILLTEIPAPPFKEGKRAEKIKELFTEIGVDSVWIDKVGNVLALRRGTKGEKIIVLDAHIDTVFPEGTNVTVKKEGNTYIAPGIGDNTRGVAMLLTVLKALNEASIKTEENIIFVGSVGEEGLGDLRGVKHLFSSKSDIKIDSWISIDGGNSGRIINGALGSKRYKVIVKGKGGHSWGAFGLANPHHALGKAIDYFSKEAANYTRKDGPRTSFNVGRMGGGTSVNSIPFESWMEIDMRSLSPKRLLEIDAILKSSVTKAIEDYNKSGVQDKVTLEIVPIGDRPSGETSKESSLIQRAIASANSVGISPQLQTSSTNSNIPISKGIPAVTISRGGRSSRAHSLDEKWTNIDSNRNIKMALLMLLSEAGLAK